MDVKHWQDEEKDWNFYYNEGKSYLGTCQRLIINRGAFDNEFIYHLAVLAGERLALGLLLSYDWIPSSTSLSGMLQEGRDFYTFDKSLLEGARLINKFQNFCALDVAPLTVPENEELEKIVKYIEKVEVFCDANLNKKAVNA